MPARVRVQRLAVPAVTLLATAGPVAVAAAPDPGRPEPVSAAAAAGPRSDTLPARVAARAVSRSLVRQEPPAATLADVEGLDVLRHLKTRWATDDLNVWPGPGEEGKRLTVLDAGGRVRVTGLDVGPWAQITRGEGFAWVRSRFLAREKPRATGNGGSATPASVSGAPCADGSSVESGLTSNAVAVYRSVCAAFPSVSSWGGLGGGGDHGAGRALDIMVTGSLGDAIADYVRAHAGELGVSYVIWAQRIWTVDRAGEGWRYMSDRGSTTANHYDHVHVSVY